MLNSYPMWAATRQKAPSAKRCIKTVQGLVHRHLVHYVRKHRAPKGALRRAQTPSRTCSRAARQKAPSAKRCIKTRGHRLLVLASLVRKHRAPKGALRRVVGSGKWVKAFLSQKAPSAKRCIKTRAATLTRKTKVRQKAPSAKRCIKTFKQAEDDEANAESESTERQKVH